MTLSIVEVYYVSAFGSGRNNKKSPEAIRFKNSQLPLAINMGRKGFQINAITTKIHVGPVGRSYITYVMYAFAAAPKNVTTRRNE